MRFPHFNRLTGLRWWRHLRNRDDSVETRQRDDTKIADLLQAPQPYAITKIGTTELIWLEYLYRRIRPRATHCQLPPSCPPLIRLLRPIPHPPAHLPLLVTRVPIATPPNRLRVPEATLRYLPVRDAKPLDPEISTVSFSLRH